MARTKSDHVCKEISIVLVMHKERFVLFLLLSSLSGIRVMN